jgi:predicted transglutaminase-like cysteine proteinase
MAIYKSIFLNNYFISLCIFLIFTLLCVAVSSRSVQARYVTFQKYSDRVVAKVEWLHHQFRPDRKWRRRYDGEAKRSRYWRHQLGQAATTDAGKLGAIFNLVNRLVTYQPDTVDLWQGPEETLARGAGDCEDLAILYLASAILSGFDRARLWLVLGYVYRPFGRQGHAVVMIEGSGEKQYVMDNMLKRVVPAEKHNNFLPVYSFNLARMTTYLQINTVFKELRTIQLEFKG